MPSTLRQTTARTLVDSITQQKLFDTNTTGAIELVPGTYKFDCRFALTAMSATSGNAAFDVLGAGTATVSKFLMQTVGQDAAALNTMSTQIGSFANIKNTPASMISAAINTGLFVSVEGTFEVTVAGTIIPSVTLVTGAVTPQVEVGSYFTVDRIGGEGQGFFVDGFRTTVSDVTVGSTRTITYNDGTVRVDKV